MGNFWASFASYFEVNQARYRQQKIQLDADLNKRDKYLQAQQLFSESRYSEEIMLVKYSMKC